MTKQQRIVFMGTPDFASHILDQLVLDQYNVVGVVTTPDRPAGRGYKLQESAVKKVALKHSLPTLQPEKLKNEDFLKDLEDLQADVFVVIAFRMLPKLVWNMPKHGTFNLHASLLPQYRGAAPIHWAVINGETETGVTTFFIDEKIDTGEVIANKTCDITNTDTVGSLHDKLMHLGVNLVKETLDQIESGEVSTQSQDSIIEQYSLVLKEAKKIFKPECHINFNQDVNQVYNHIRGLNPFPGAWATLTSEGDKDKQIKLFNCTYTNQTPSQPAGTFYLEDNLVKIACINGEIVMNTLQLEGKKRMDAGDFQRGFNFDKSYILK